MTGQQQLWGLLRALATADQPAVDALLAAHPALARAVVAEGASRAAPSRYLGEIQHHIYEGDTALHVAAAGYRLEDVRRLIALGADVAAANRRGAQALHYAADGTPGSGSWDPVAQAAVIALLLKAGAAPDAVDKSDVTPLHRAVRKRCAAAVEALLAGGADPTRRNGSGSTPMMLATRATGRAESGSAASKAQQTEIIRLLG